MTQESEIEFFERRAVAELDQADFSRDEKIAGIHRQLAMAYARRVAELGGLPPAFMMHGSGTTSRSASAQ